MVYSGAGGKLIHEKNPKSKILWHCPFKRCLPESILFLVAVSSLLVSVSSLLASVSSLLASVSSTSLPIYADRISTKYEQRNYRLRSPRCKLWPLSRYYMKTCWLILFSPKDGYFCSCLEWFSFVNTSNMYCMWKDSKPLCCFLSFIIFIILSFVRFWKKISQCCMVYSLLELETTVQVQYPHSAIYFAKLRKAEIFFLFFFAAKNMLVFLC